MKTMPCGRRFSGARRAFLHWGGTHTCKSYIFLFRIQLQIQCVTEMNNKFNIKKKIGKILNKIGRICNEKPESALRFKEQMVE